MPDTNPGEAIVIEIQVATKGNGVTILHCRSNNGDVMRVVGSEGKMYIQ